MFKISVKSLRQKWRDVQQRARERAADRILHPHKRKFTWTRFLLASSALSTVLCLGPAGIYSQSPKEYLRERGLPEETADYFTSENMRVYHRRNPLFPWAFAGHVAAANWKDPSPETGLGEKILTTPVSYVVGLASGIITFSFPNTLDAFALSANTQPVAVRNCFIRPPKDISFDEFVNDFTGLDLEKINTTSDKKSLGPIFQHYVIAHEMRHCEQNSAFSASSLGESDADVYGLRVVEKTSPANAATQAEAKVFLRHMRALNGLGHDPGHASTLAMGRAASTPFDAHNDYAAFQKLSGILADAARINQGAFKNDKGEVIRLNSVERDYYLTVALVRSGILKEKDTLAVANAFIEAVEFFNKATDNGISTAAANGKIVAKIDLEIFTREYMPVPDKISKNPLKPAV